MEKSIQGLGNVEKSVGKSELLLKAKMQKSVRNVEVLENSIKNLLSEILFNN